MHPALSASHGEVCRVLGSTRGPVPCPIHAYGQRCGCCLEQCSSSLDSEVMGGRRSLFTSLWPFWDHLSSSELP